MAYYLLCAVTWGFSPGVIAAVAVCKALSVDLQLSQQQFIKR
ncbi:hypothetical protein ACQ4N7_07535 [Nodosilinea sp. AN01ver1]